MESYNSNVDKSKNKLFKDSEFISQTKKAIHFARLGNFLASEKIFKELISKSKYDYLTLHRLAGISLRLGKDAQYRSAKHWLLPKIIPLKLMSTVPVF